MERRHRLSEFAEKRAEIRLVAKLLIFVAAVTIFAAGALAQATVRPDTLSTLVARAERGDALAQFDVGYAYQTGEGVPKDPATAAQWYRRSAENGNVGAQFMLGFMYRTGEGVDVDYSEALKWYRKAAKAGDGASASEIGAMFEHGHGVVTDSEEAARWYKKAGRAWRSKWLRKSSPMLPRRTGSKAG
jgi:TPR repeat protein